MRPPIVWDGKSWSTLGGGVSGKDPSEVGLIVSDESDIYIAGNFTKAGQIYANNIARWNKGTSSWFALGEGISLVNEQALYDIDIDSQHVYICGWFILSDTIGYVARWSKKNLAWELLCHQYNASWTNQMFTSLLVEGDTLYCGGKFELIQDSSHFFNLAGLNLRTNRWFGLTDDSVDLQFENDGHISDILPGPGSDIYIAGKFTLKKRGSSQIIAYSLASWDGRSWERVFPEGTVWYYPRLSSSDGVLYASGSFSIPINASDTVRNVASWDGISWKQELGNPSWNYGRIMKIRGDIYTSKIEEGNFGRWNGRFLTPIDSGFCHGMSNYSGIQCSYLDEDTLFVAGLFDYGGGVLLNNIGKWTGDRWEPIGEGLKTLHFQNFNAIIKYKDELYLGGNFSVQLQGDTVYDLIKWNGENWVKPFGNNSFGGFVHALEVASDTLFIAGWQQFFSDSSYNLVAFWDGKDLRQLGTGLSEGNYVWSSYVRDLHYQNGFLYAGGNFTHSGKDILNRVARWKDGEWLPLGPTTTNGIGDSTENWDVFALSGKDDTLYIGGYFSEIANGPAPDFAKYDGRSVVPIGIEPVGSWSRLTALAYDQGRVYFYRIADISIFTPNPACLIDDKIYQFGKNVAEIIHRSSEGVTSILPYKDNQLIFTGDIGRAGNVVSYSIAIWHFEPEGNVSMNASAKENSIYPNPASRVIYIDIPEANGVVCKVSIMDVMGRQIASHLLSYQAGQALKLDIGELPVGMYYAITEIQNSYTRHPFVVSR